MLLKRAVRDEWDNAESDIQKERKSLEALLGVEVKLAVEWPLLWTELKALYPDKNVFVPNIVSVTRTLFRSLNVKLEDEENTAWNDLFLEEITKAQGFRVSFAVRRPQPPISHFCVEQPFRQPQSPNHISNWTSAHRPFPWPSHPKTSLR